MMRLNPLLQDLFVLCLINMTGYGLVLRWDWLDQVIQGEQTSLTGHLLLGIAFAGFNYAVFTWRWTDLAKRVTPDPVKNEAQQRLAFLTQLLDTVGQAVIAIDLTGKIIYWNRFAETLYGQPAAQVMGYSFLEVISTEISPDQRTEMMAHLNAGENWAREFLIKRGDGTVFPALFTNSPISDDQGKLIGIIGISVDLTVRKQVEAKIQHHHRALNLLNQLIAASATGQEPQAILGLACRELASIFDLAYANIALLNEQKDTAQVMADYAADDPTGSRPDLRQTTFSLATNPVLQHLLTQKTPLVVADAPHDPRLAHFHNLPGRRGVASILFVPLIIEGEVVGGLGLEARESRDFLPEEISLAWRAADQVAAALARAQLNQVQQRLSAAIEQVAESVIITDLNGIIIYVNPAFERVSGYSRAEVLGQNPRLLKSDQHGADFYADMWATLSAGRVWQGRLVNRKKDGTRYTEEATITPVRNEEGAIVNYVGVKRDITYELQLEEQYRQAQKMEAIGHLAGGVAHDFNNLLVVINGYSELLLDRHLDETSSDQNYVLEIKKAGERAAGLTRQLLAFSRQQVLHPQILEPNAVVANTEKMLRRLIGEDIDLITRLDPKLGRVKADAGQIEQIIMNLAVNARDAMPQGGKLTIETTNMELDETYARQHLEVKPGSYVMVAVSDTGTGMDAATKARIFEPFFTTKAPGQGTGLGLATVYGIVKQSGGAIWVYSEPGHGTTFKIYLPRVQEAAPLLEPLLPSPLPLPAGQETILLVEDAQAVRGLAREALEAGGYTVLEASQGEEALRLAEQCPQPIHLLVTDVILPRVNGRDLATRLTRTQPEMKVLFISGYTDRVVEDHGLLEAGVSFLPKPFSLKVLAHKVREILDKSQENE